MGREQTALREDLAKRILKFIKSNRWGGGRIYARPSTPRNSKVSASELASISYFRSRPSKFRCFSHFFFFLFIFETTRSMTYSIIFLLVSFFVPWSYVCIKIRSLNSRRCGETSVRDAVSSRLERFLRPSATNCISGRIIKIYENY